MPRDHSHPPTTSPTKPFNITQTQLFVLRSNWFRKIVLMDVCVCVAGGLAKMDCSRTVFYCVGCKLSGCSLLHTRTHSHTHSHTHTHTPLPWGGFLQSKPETGQLVQTKSRPNSDPDTRPSARAQTSPDQIQTQPKHQIQL